MTLSASYTDITGNDRSKITVRTTYGPVINTVTEDRSHVAAFWGDLGRLLRQDPEHVELLARRAYERYVDHAGGVSKFTQERLPSWDEQDEEIRGHWRHSVSE